MSEVHEAVGSYVVDALGPAERVEFEAHLPGCQSCRIQVTDLSKTVARMAVLVDRPAPASLRASVLAAISEVRQLAPEETVRLEHQASLAAVPVPVHRRTSVLAGVDGPAPLNDEVAPLEEHPSVIPDWSWPVPVDHPVDLQLVGSRRTARLLTALVAACMVAVLALGGWTYSLSQQRQAELAATQRETELLSAPDAKVLSSSVGGSTVTYVVSKQRDQAMLVSSDLADPGAGKTYQLWTLKGTVATSAGLVRAGGNVRQWFGVPVRDSDRLALTREPSPNGSTTATGPPLSSVSI